MSHVEQSGNLKPNQKAGLKSCHVNKPIERTNNMNANSIYELEQLKEKVALNRCILEIWIDVLPHMDKCFKTFQEWLEKHQGQVINKRVNTAMKEAFRGFDFPNLSHKEFRNVSLRTFVDFEFSRYQVNAFQFSVNMEVIYSLKTDEFGCKYDKSFWINEDGMTIGKIDVNLVEGIKNMRRKLKKKIHEAKDLLNHYEDRMAVLVQKAEACLQAMEDWEKATNLFNSPRCFIAVESCPKLNKR